MFKKCLLGALLLASAQSYSATVLIYHHVSTSMPASTSIAPDRFMAHMDYLEKNQFNIVPLTELVELHRQHKPLPDKTVAITFDDSYADVYTAAYPILKKRGWPFTFFVNTDSVGAGKLFVTWDQLRDMSKHGVTIANHTKSHEHVVRLKAGETKAQWRERIEMEIDGAQQKIEKEIGSAPKIFAYPFGEYNADVREILKDKGYIAFTQQAGVLNPLANQQTLPRFPFGGSYTQLDDFIQKVNALPLPVASVSYATAERKPLADMNVKAGDKPFLIIELANESLLKKTECFASSEGRTYKEVQGNKIWIQTTKGLPMGRTKITCTAPSGEKGRFYWFNQLWLAADAKGNWMYND